MGLDLSALSHQVRMMSGSLATEASDTQQRTTLALGRYLEESADRHVCPHVATVLVRVDGRHLCFDRRIEREADRDTIFRVVVAV